MSSVTLEDTDLLTEALRDPGLSIPVLALLFPCPVCKTATGSGCWSELSRTPLSMPHDDRLQIAQSGVRNLAQASAPHLSHDYHGPWIVRDPADHTLIRTCLARWQVRETAETLCMTGHEAEVMSPGAGDGKPLTRLYVPSEWAEPAAITLVILQWSAPGEPWRDLMSLRAWETNPDIRWIDLRSIRQAVSEQIEWRMILRREQELGG